MFVDACCSLVDLCVFVVFLSFFCVCLGYGWQHLIYVVRDAVTIKYITLKIPKYFVTVSNWWSVWYYETVLCKVKYINALLFFICFLLFFNTSFIHFILFLYFFICPLPFYLLHFFILFLHRYVQRYVFAWNMCVFTLIYSLNITSCRLSVCYSYFKLSFPTRQ